MEYRNLEMWLKARNLVKEVYILSNQFPRNEEYSLTSQIRRSAISVPSNIAEGCGRRSFKETVQFLYIARGSIYELETQLYLTFDLQFINQQQLDNTIEQIITCKKLINGFINYLKKQETK